VEKWLRLRFGALVRASETRATKRNAVCAVVLLVVVALVFVVVPAQVDDFLGDCHNMHDPEQQVETRMSYRHK
jgi:hypothetical protein